MKKQNELFVSFELEPKEIKKMHDPKKNLTICVEKKKVMIYEEKEEKEEEKIKKIEGRTDLVEYLKKRNPNEHHHINTQNCSVTSRDKKWSIDELAKIEEDSKNIEKIKLQLDKDFKIEATFYLTKESFLEN